MANLPASLRSNLTAWFRGDDYVNGAALSSGVWLDASGNGRFLQCPGSGASNPTREEAALNGHAVVAFDGAAQSLSSFNSSAVLSDYITNALGTVYTVVRVDALTTNSGTWHENDCVWRGQGSAAGIVLKTTPAAFFVNDDGAADGLAVTVAEGGWYILIWRHSGGTLYAGEGDADGHTSIASSNTTTVNQNIVLGLSSVPTYTAMALAEQLYFKANHTAQQMSQMLGYLKAKLFSGRDGVASAKYIRTDSLEQARRFGGQILVERGHARTHVAEDLPFAAFDDELLTDVRLSHPLGRGGAWGTGETERRHVRIYATDWDIDRMTASVTMRDLRDQQFTYWESGSTVRVGDETRQGMAVCGGAACRVLFRASSTWAQDPASGMWGRALPGNEAVGVDGITLRPPRTNILRRSSFADGVASLTVTPGSGSAAFDSTVTMFDETAITTPGSMKLTAGNPNTTGVIVEWPVTEDVSTYVDDAHALAFVVWHRDDGGEEIAYQLYDSATTQYWGGAGWGAAPGTYVTVPLGSATAWTEYLAWIPRASGASSTWRLRIRQPSGGTAYRVNYVGHVEVQGKALGASSITWRSGLIVTEAAAVERAADELYLTDPDGILNEPQFTARFGLRPEWSAADGEEDIVIARAGDADNYVQWRWDASNTRLAFDVVDGANTATAYCAWTPVAGTWYELGFRLTGTQGELGLAAVTADAFVDGVKGTSATCASLPVGFGSPFHWSDAAALASSFARWAVTNPAGVIRGIRFSPYCLTDAEIAAGL